MLAEVLTAIALVALGLVALATAIPVAGMAVREGAQLSTATFLAGARLEEVRAAEWSARPQVDRLGVSGSVLSAPQSGGTTTFADEATLPSPYADYSRQVRIRECDILPGCGGVTSARLRIVTVIVAYRSAAFAGTAPLHKTASITTLVAER